MSTESSSTVTLWCQAGEHNWERPKVRGKRPFNCPEHSPERATPTAGLTEAEREARAAEAAERRREKNEAARQENIEKAVVARKFFAEDAALWAAFQAGEISREKWLRDKPKMPEFPPEDAWVEARAAGRI